MIDQLVTEATRPLIDAGILGSVVLLMIIAFVLRERQHMREIDKKDAEIARREAEIADEREAHQMTRDAQLEDIRTFAKIGEGIREQMKSSEIAMNAFIDASRRTAA